MSKHDEKAKVGENTGEQYLEYIGTKNRIFLDLPVVKEGSVVKVPSKKVKALLATGFFKKSNQKPVEKTVKES